MRFRDRTSRIRAVLGRVKPVGYGVNTPLM